MIYQRPDLIFDATSCGQNCAKWLVEIGKKKDVTVNLNYLMHLEEVDGFEAYIDNENKLVSTPKDYVYTAVDYSCAAEPPIRCGVSHLSGQA